MSHPDLPTRIRSTTILGLVRGGRASMGGDGQVTIDTFIVKAQAHKIRTMHEGRILTGFAGAAADAFTLFERFEDKLNTFKGNLPRAAVEMAKDWRTDRYLRRLDALLAVMDTQHGFILSGTGDIIEPDDGILAIGSGGPYALAAARSLIAFTDQTPHEIVHNAMSIAADICIFTNNQFEIADLGPEGPATLAHVQVSNLKTGAMHGEPVPALEAPQKSLPRNTRTVQK